MKTREQTADEQLDFERALSFFLVEWVLQETRREEKHNEKRATQG